MHEALDQLWFSPHVPAGLLSKLIEHSSVQRPSGERMHGIPTEHGLLVMPNTNFPRVKYCPWDTIHSVK